MAAVEQRSCRLEKRPLDDYLNGSAIRHGNAIVGLELQFAGRIRGLGHRLASVTLGVASESREGGTVRTTELPEWPPWTLGPQRPSAPGDGLRMARAASGLAASSSSDTPSGSGSSSSPMSHRFVAAPEARRP